jgi:RimJ/RimL family protein N-acetyltransferase
MNVSLRPVEDRDLDTIYQQVTDPESVRMAAFTAEDQTDRRAFLNRMSRLRADTSVSYRVIDVDGAIAGTIASFRIDNQPEVTYWVDRTQWGKGIASAALQILLAETAERPLYARAASDNLGSLRVLEKAGFRRIGVNRDFAPSRGEEIEETILRLDGGRNGTVCVVVGRRVIAPARVTSGCGARRWHGRASCWRAARMPSAQTQYPRNGGWRHLEDEEGSSRISRLTSQIGST